MSDPANFHAVLREMQQEIVRLRNIVSESNYPNPEPKLRLPDTFDGTRSKLRGFKNQIEMIWELNPKRYPTARTKVLFVGTLLVGSALQWFSTLFESSDPCLDDLVGFFTKLDNTFGD